MWLLFPDKGIHKNDIRIKSATRWPTILDLSQFQAATGQEKYPASLDDYVEGDCLTYFGNNTVDFEIHGLNIHVDTRWDFMAGPDGLDTYSAITRGEKARIELRQNEATNFESEIFVKPVSHSMDQLQMLLEAKIKDISQKYEGLGLIRQDGEFQLSIPKKLRTGHESHFGMITRQFSSHLRKESPIPSWEFANHLSRYFITVEGVKMSRGTV
jgi:hypothetical protein